MSKYLITQFGIYNKEIGCLIIAFILIFIFIKSLQRYEEIDEKILDDHVLDIYAEIYDELNDMLYVENINDPFINLEEKVSNFFKKRKIPENKKEKIFRKFNAFIDKENSSLFSKFIYFDGKIQNYILLKNLDSNI